MRVLTRAGRWVTVAAFLAAATTVLTLAGLQMQGRQLLTVMSGSMTPTFGAGDVVIVERRAPNELQPGMIVTFHPPGSPDRLTTHRILALQTHPEGLFLQTGGDANATPDPDFTSAGDVVGVVTATVPMVGRWFAAYQAPAGRLLILGTPLLLLLIGQGVESVRDLRRLRRRHTGSTGHAPSSSDTREGRPGLSTLSASVAVVGLLASAAGGGVLLGHRTAAAYTSSATTTLSVSTAAW